MPRKKNRGKIPAAPLTQELNEYLSTDTLSKEAEFPRSPGPGKLGRKIKLYANCYGISLPSGSVFHYDIQIASRGAVHSDPKKYRCLNTKCNRKVVHHLLKQCPLFEGQLAAFDGKKNLYTRKPLTDVDSISKGETITGFPHEIEENRSADHSKYRVVIEVEIPANYTVNENDPLEEYTMRSKPEKFTVAIQPVEAYEIRLDALHAFYSGVVNTVLEEAVMAVETIFRCTPCFQHYPVGRLFFHFPRDKARPLGKGKEIWPGHHQSVRLGEKKPLLNLDVAATTFYRKRPLLEVISDVMRCTVSELKNKILDERDRNEIASIIKPTKIATTHLKTYKKVCQVGLLTEKSANTLEFSYGEGRITVNEYFKVKHNMVLQFPNLPCVQTKRANPELFPVEVCEIVPGHVKKKLSPMEVAEMIKYAAKNPETRFEEIHGLKQKADFNNDKYLKEFDISVDNRFLSLDGRVLEAPGLRYQCPQQPVRPYNGQWDMKEKKYLTGATIRHWELVSFSNKVHEGKLKDIARKLTDMGRSQGMNISDATKCLTLSSRDFHNTIPKTLMKMKDRNTEFVVVVLPPQQFKENKDMYNKIKWISETKLGIITQCVQDANVLNPKKFNASFVSNLCLKINTKMSGENNALLTGEIPEKFRESTIVFGADVNHPPPAGDNDERKPSIAAVVGSTSSNFTKYAAKICHQYNPGKKAEESIKTLDAMVLDILREHVKVSKSPLPQKIVFYRDGVSDGEFARVKQVEVEAIQKACRRLEPQYNPKLTYIVVQKNHHVRFVPQNFRDGVGSQKNVPPGTTVDTAVTHPYNFDYFQCSQMGLQGTSKPAHYTVVKDDNRLTADDMQKMSYYLCHVFARCTKSVSTPAPVRYADLAAYRGRIYLDAARGPAPTVPQEGGRDIPVLPTSIYYV